MGGNACGGAGCYDIGTLDSMKNYLISSQEPYQQWGFVSYSNTKIHYNGATIAVAATEAVGFRFSILGNRFKDYGLYHMFLGDIAEVLIFNNNLTVNDKEATDGYFFDKYAPPLNLGKNLVIERGLCAPEISPRTYFESLLWSDGSTGDSLVAPGAGTYWCQGTDIYGRISSDTIVIFPASYNYIADSTICGGTNMTWDPEFTDTSFSYIWSDGSTDSLIVASDTGKYYFTVTDKSGCFINSDTMVIRTDSFSANLSETILICVTEISLDH